MTGFTSFADNETVPLRLNHDTKVALSCSVDGVRFGLTYFRETYVANPLICSMSGETSGVVYQQMNLFFPEHANHSSPIILIVGNGGWMPTPVPENTVTDGDDYNSANSNIGAAIKAGYVIVSIGTRSRGLLDVVSGYYAGHSPAVIADTKSAIRFLRINAPDLPAGDPDKIVITGISGGGALSAVIAASGNSPDFFPSLFEIGAAGIHWIGSKPFEETSDEDKSRPANYSSDIRDDVFAAIAYCPIIELSIADMAYEWDYNAVRPMLPANDAVNGSNAPIKENRVMQASGALAAKFAEYVDALGLLDENGVRLFATWDSLDEDSVVGAAGGNLKEAIRMLLEKAIGKAISELSQGSVYPDAITGDPKITGSDGELLAPWLSINGTPVSKAYQNPNPDDTATIYDLNAYLRYVGGQSSLKSAPAFDNLGTVNKDRMNENNLWGNKDQKYGHVNAWSWNHDTGEVPGIGKENTGMTWEAFLRTENGQALALQMKMSTPIPYLVGKDKIPYLKHTDSSDVRDIAPHWYVRHGMRDVSSFAVKTLLYYSLYNNSDVKSLNFSFAWMKPHGGNYDVGEAYAWLADLISREE